MPHRPATYENEALGVLVYEFPFTDPAETDAVITRRLKRKKLGAFDPGRIAELRALKDDLQAEIGLAEDSTYFTGRHDAVYSDMRDFDLARLCGAMATKHPAVPPMEIDGFVPFCVLTYYLR
ncbi:MAG: hypothetical protein U0P81_02780 [Holophagaceae bacterium]